MVYRYPHAAPAGQLPEERRGRVVGRFCLVCGSLYPLHRAKHSGKPLYGRDHVASPCAHEGDTFDPGEDWWNEAVEVLPAAVTAGDPGVANVPAKGTEPSATGQVAPGGPVNVPGKGVEQAAHGREATPEQKDKTKG